MQATGIIVSRVEQELRESFRGLNSAPEICETLKEINENQSTLVVARVRSEWENSNFTSDEGILVYLGKLEKCRRLLIGTNAEIGWVNCA